MVWISTGIVGFQGLTLCFDLLNATARPVQLAAAQWRGDPSRLTRSQPQAQELLVLPELTGLPRGLQVAEIARRAERRGGSFEQLLAQRAKAGNGYLVGIYPERDGSRVFPTAALTRRPGPGRVMPPRW